MRAGLRNGVRLRGERIACDREPLARGIQAMARNSELMSACSHTINLSRLILLVSVCTNANKHMNNYVATPLTGGPRHLPSPPSVK